MGKLQQFSLLLLGYLGSALGHIYFETPGPRTCFYGGYFGTDPDGAWRQEPCDRQSAPPKVTYVPGQEICLTVHEFVDHPGYYDIAISYTPVNPGDNNAEFVTIASLIPDVGDGTGYQSFIVTLPENRTCDHCTIQIKQWADDLQWFYYACTDVEIVNGVTNTTISPSTCQFRSGPALLRILILQDILIGTYFLTIVLFLAAFCFAGYCNKDVSQDLEEKSQDGKVAVTERIVEYSKRKKRCMLVAAIVYLLLAVALGVTLIGLKSCW